MSRLNHVGQVGANCRRAPAHACMMSLALWGNCCLANCATPTPVAAGVLMWYAFSGKTPWCCIPGGGFEVNSNFFSPDVPAARQLPSFLDLCAWCAGSGWPMYGVKCTGMCMDVCMHYARRGVGLCATAPTWPSNQHYQQVHAPGPPQLQLPFLPQLSVGPHPTQPTGACARTPRSGQAQCRSKKGWS